MINSVKLDSTSKAGINELGFKQYPHQKILGKTFKNMKGICKMNCKLYAIVHHRNTYDSNFDLNDESPVEKEHNLSQWRYIESAFIHKTTTTNLLPVFY